VTFDRAMRVAWFLLAATTLFLLYRGELSLDLGAGNVSLDGRVTLDHEGSITH
jgi:hypothetical protein